MDAFPGGGIRMPPPGGHPNINGRLKANAYITYMALPLEI